MINVVRVHWGMTDHPYKGKQQSSAVRGTRYRADKIYIYKKKNNKPKGNDVA